MVWRPVLEEFAPGDMVEVIEVKNGEGPRLWSCPGSGQPGSVVVATLRPGSIVLVLGREPGSPRNWWYVAGNGVMGWLCNVWIGQLLSG